MGGLYHADPGADALALKVGSISNARAPFQAKVISEWTMVELARMILDPESSIVLGGQ